MAHNLSYIFFFSTQTSACFPKVILTEFIIHRYIYIIMGILKGGLNNHTEITEENLGFLSHSFKIDRDNGVQKCHSRGFTNINNCVV